MILDEKFCTNILKKSNCRVEKDKIICNFGKELNLKIKKSC